MRAFSTTVDIRERCCQGRLVAIAVSSSSLSSMKTSNLPPRANAISSEQLASLVIVRFPAHEARYGYRLSAEACERTTEEILRARTAGPTPLVSNALPQYQGKELSGKWDRISPRRSSGWEV